MYNCHSDSFLSVYIQWPHRESEEKLFAAMQAKANLASCVMGQITTKTPVPYLQQRPRSLAPRQSLADGIIGANASYKLTCASSPTLASFAGLPTLSPLALA